MTNAARKFRMNPAKKGPRDEVSNITLCKYFFLCISTNHDQDQTDAMRFLV
jgi:hypothetical protein